MKNLLQIILIGVACALILPVLGLNWLIERLAEDGD
jgi:hypothetical protein